MKKSSAFGAIIGKDRLDAKSITPKSEANFAMEANRPQSTPTFGGRRPWKQQWLDMRLERRALEIQNSVRKRLSR